MAIMGDDNVPCAGEVVGRIGQTHTWRVRLDDGSVLVCHLSRSYIGCRVREPEKRLPRVGERVLVERSSVESDKGRIVSDRRDGITVRRYR
jgi:translation initiation factor IF-1